MCFKVWIFIFCNQNGFVLYFWVFFIDSSLSVSFHVVAQMFCIENLPAFVLNVGTFNEPAGILNVEFKLLIV